MRRHSTPPQRASRSEAVSPQVASEFAFVELPIFTMDQGAQITRFLAGEAHAPADTLVRLVPCSPVGFYKDGVLVRPMGDHMNMLVKATACGCLYWFRDPDARWLYLDCGPEDIVWHHAPPD